MATVGMRSLISATVAFALVALLGCSDSQSVALPDDQCIQVLGSGSTVGTVKTLMGSGSFTFDGVERSAEVALYIFELTDLGDAQKSARVVYQFLWQNGDFFVSNDPGVVMSPSFKLDTFTFSVAMTITLGSGVYENMDGQRPYNLTAEISFGPPTEQGGPMTAVETFDMSGLLCPP